MTLDVAATPYREARIYLITPGDEPRLIRRTGLFWCLACAPYSALAFNGMPAYEWAEQDRLTAEQLRKLLWDLSVLQRKVEAAKTGKFHAGNTAMPPAGAAEAAYRNAVVATLQHQIHALLGLEEK